MPAKPSVTYDGTTYKVRSARTEVPDLDQMERLAALIWLNRNTYARGTNHRAPRVNLPAMDLRVS